MGQTYFPVLGTMSESEQVALAGSSDPVAVLCHWISELIAWMSEQGLLEAHPSIISRIYQEISNGCLGSSYAMKISLIPFPFPFAQMLTLLLFFFGILFPLMVCYLTKNMVFAPIIAFVVVLCYWGLNCVAV